MLKDSDKSILQQNRINIDDVESFDSATWLVTFKNGAQRRLTEIWCRVMGYFAPSTSFNRGKYSEFRSRKYFTEEKSCGDKS